MTVWNAPISNTGARLESGKPRARVTMVKCLDCPAEFKKVGCKARCGPCSDAHISKKNAERRTRRRQQKQ